MQISEDAIYRAQLKVVTEKLQLYILLQPALPYSIV